MLLRVGSAAAVRNGVLLCAAVGVCALRVLCVRLQKEQKPAQLVECKRHESCPWQALQLLRCVRADLCVRKG